jgi:very-short-patch-repair endonuclease
VAGVSRHAIAAAVERGALLRVRRGWVAAPDADPMLVTAARKGVVLTCVTQAKRRGLWVIDDGEVHVAAPPHAGRIDVGAHVHWQKPAVPRDPDSLVDSVENLLMIVAGCQPRDHALAVWNSALRDGEADMDVLRGLPMSSAARELLEEATPFADSGLETVVVPRLRWLGLPMRRQIWIAGHRVDLLIGENLVFQIDGGHHVGEQRTRDIEHDARLMLKGYHVIRVGYDQVMNGWPAVQELIMRAVAQGLHRAR